MDVKFIKGSDPDIKGLDKKTKEGAIIFNEDAQTIQLDGTVYGVSPSEVHNEISKVNTNIDEVWNTIDDIYEGVDDIYDNITDIYDNIADIRDNPSSGGGEGGDSEGGDIYHRKGNRNRKLIVHKVVPLEAIQVGEVYFFRETPCFRFDGQIYYGKESPDDESIMQISDGFTWREDEAFPCVDVALDNCYTPKGYIVYRHSSESAPGDLLENLNDWITVRRVFISMAETRSPHFEIHDNRVVCVKKIGEFEVIPKHYIFKGNYVNPDDDAEELVDNLNNMIDGQTITVYQKCNRLNTYKHAHELKEPRKEKRFYKMKKATRHQLKNFMVYGNVKHGKKIYRSIYGYHLLRIGKNNLTNTRFVRYVRI